MIPDCVCACVHARAHARVCVCVRACAREQVSGQEKPLQSAVFVDTRLNPWRSIHQPCELLNGVVAAQVAMDNIAVRYHRLRDGQV